MAFQGTRYTLAYGLIALVLLVAVGFLVWGGGSSQEQNSAADSQQTQRITATFACDAGKSIVATFTNVKNLSAGSGPAGTSTVDLSLSDGRRMTLAQTISADGARYSDGDPMTEGSETFVFWNKGNTALVLEHNEAKSYTGCIVLAPDPGGLPKGYSSGTNGFSIRIPEGYTVNSTYHYTALGPGKAIAGVQFSIPNSIAEGTNLASDSYVSVETKANVQHCSAALFLDGVTAREVVEDDTTYSIATSTGAAAGNRYEETVYAIPGTNPCLAVRYLIHYGVIENYPAGAVKVFDKAALLAQFDAIRRTLTVGQ